MGDKIARDWEAARPVIKGIRQYGNVRVVGRIKPYNELIDKLSEAAYKMKHTDRKALQKLAWFLGVNGETQACVAIMEHAAEPEIFMYGVPACD